MSLQPEGYINGTVTCNSLPVEGAVVSTVGASSVTDSNGNYSLRVVTGIHDVCVSKLPEYYVNTTTGIDVVVDITTIQDIELTKKPTYEIRGVVSK